MVLAASFSMTAVAQHYVKIKNNTNSINGSPYKIGDILDEEVDSAQVLFIHIKKQSTNENTRRNGVVDGAKFPIKEFNNDPKKVKFEDNKGESRDNCFREGEILIKIDNDYLKFDDVEFLSSKDVNDSREKIKQEIKNACVYNAETKELKLTGCQYKYRIGENEYNDDKQYNIDPNTQITFLTTKDDVPNIVLSANNFVKAVVQEKKQSGGILNWFKENWMIIFGAVVVIVIAVFLVFGLRNKKQTEKYENDFDYNDDRMTDNMKKQNHKNDKKHKNKDSHKQMMGELDNHNKDEKEEIKTSVIDERLFHKLTTLIERVDSTQSSIREQSITLDRIKSLVENTDEKKQLAQKIQELEDEKKKSASVDEKLKEAHANIEDLKEQIEQLQAASQIEGAVQVTEYSTFVSFAKKILSECIDAENIAIKYWASLSSKNQQILNGFLSKFQMTKCQIDLAKWNGIIATLDLKGYIKNDEYVKYLSSLSDKDRLVFLNKRFYEEVLCPYIGATILFLEQIRTATKIGVSVPCNENIEGFINSICTKCVEQGVSVDYRKLYEKVTEYDSLEIEENIPDFVKKVIANIEEEDILLYVDKYAVNLKSGDMTEKTRCYIKI